MRPAVTLATILTFAGAGCAADEPTSTTRKQAPMIDHLANGDLKWEGNAFGLQPRIADPVSAGVVTNPSVADADLRKLLRDPQRFAIAHVILTMRSGKVGSFDAQQWNGLHVSLEASGAVRYDHADMDKLVAQWESK